VALGIKFLPLGDRVEYTEVGRRIGAAASDPLPATAVVGKIRIQQRVPEPLRPLSPVNQKVLGEKRSGNHTDSVMHVAGMPQFPHTCIHDRVAGLPRLPCQQLLPAAHPGETVEYVFERLLG